MIESIGVDIVNLERFQRILQRWGDTFLTKVLTSHELGVCRSKKSPIPCTAARFAVKEALYKALPEPFQKKAHWQNVEIQNNADGKPYVVCFGEMKKLSKEYYIHISISHSINSAVAMVVLEKKECER